MNQPVDDDHLELLHALVVQVKNTVHLYVEAVQILEEGLHPTDHYLMVLPAELDLAQKLGPGQVCQQGDDL